MRKLVIVAWATLVASPVLASTDKGAIGGTLGAPLDVLFPEIAVDDDGWRGLLPVILYNTEELADQPKPAGGADKRSERDEQR
jgi:hypothetical protein